MIDQHGKIFSQTSFGYPVIQPFRTPDLMAPALKIPMDLKTREEEGEVFGKWALRKSLEYFCTPSRGEDIPYMRSRHETERSVVYAGMYRTGG